MSVSTLVELLYSLTSPKLIELELKNTLNLCDFPLTMTPMSFPLVQRILKLPRMLQSENAEVKVHLEMKDILGGMTPWEGLKVKNCSSNSPSYFRYILNYAGTSELFLRMRSLVMLLVTSTCPKSS